jgi:hypothetical protein
MPGGDLLQILSTPESFNQPILLFGRPCLPDTTRPPPAAGARGSLRKSRATRQHCSHDIDVLQDRSGRKVILCKRIYTVHQRLQNLTCLLICHFTSPPATPSPQHGSGEPLMPKRSQLIGVPVSSQIERRSDALGSDVPRIHLRSAPSDLLIAVAAIVTVP